MGKFTKAEWKKAVEKSRKDISKTASGRAALKKLDASVKKSTPTKKKSRSRSSSSNSIKSTIGKGIPSIGGLFGETKHPSGAFSSEKGLHDKTGKVIVTASEYKKIGAKASLKKVEQHETKRRRSSRSKEIKRIETNVQREKRTQQEISKPFTEDKAKTIEQRQESKEMWARNRAQLIKKKIFEDKPITKQDQTAAREIGLNIQQETAAKNVLKKASEGKPLTVQDYDIARKVGYSIKDVTDESIRGSLRNKLQKTGKLTTKEYEKLGFSTNLISTLEGTRDWMTSLTSQDRRQLEPIKSNRKYIQWIKEVQKETQKIRKDKSLNILQKEEALKKAVGLTYYIESPIRDMFKRIATVKEQKQSEINKLNEKARKIELSGGTISAGNKSSLKKTIAEQIRRIKDELGIKHIVELKKPGEEKKKDKFSLGSIFEISPELNRTKETAEKNWKSDGWINANKAIYNNIKKKGVKDNIWNIALGVGDVLKGTEDILNVFLDVVYDVAVPVLKGRSKQLGLKMSPFTTKKQYKEELKEILKEIEPIEKTEREYTKQAGKVLKFVYEHPVESAAIVGTVAVASGKDYTKSFIDNPVRTLGSILADVYGYKILRLADNLLKFKTIKKLSSSFVPTKHNINVAIESLLKAKVSNKNALKTIKNLKLKKRAERDISLIGKEIKRLKSMYNNKNIITTQTFNEQAADARNLLEFEKKVNTVYHVTQTEPSVLLKGSEITETQLNKLIKDIKKNPEQYVKDNLETKKLKLITKNSVEKIAVQTLKEDKTAFIGGSGSLKLQLKKFREIGDIDIISKEPERLANKIANNLNKKDILSKVFGTKSRYKVHKTPKLEVYRVFDSGAKGKNKFSTKNVVVDVDALSQIENNIGRKLTTKDFRTIDDIRVLKAETQLSRKVVVSQTPEFAKRKAKELKDIKFIVGEKLKDKKAKLITYLFDKSGVLKVRPGEVGKGRKVFGEDHFYTDISAALGYAQKDAPVTILRFQDIKITKFPKALKSKILKASKGELEKGKQIKLRIDLNKYIRKNQDKFTPGPRTLAFGIGESELVAPVGSRFYTKKNIRTRINSIFGKTVGNKFTINPETKEFIEVFDMLPNKEKTSVIKDIENTFNEYGKLYGSWEKIKKTLKLRFSKSDVTKARGYKKLIRSGEKINKNDESKITSFIKNKFKESIPDKKDIIKIIKKDKINKKGKVDLDKISKQIRESKARKPGVRKTTQKTPRVRKSGVRKAGVRKSGVRKAGVRKTGARKPRTPKPRTPTPRTPTPRTPTPRTPTPRTPTPRTPTPRTPTPRTPTPRTPTPRTPTPRTPTPRTPTPRTPTPRKPTPRTPTPRKPTPGEPVKDPRRLPTLNFKDNLFKDTKNKKLKVEINYRQRADITRNTDPIKNPVVLKVMKIEATPNRVLLKMEQLADRKTIVSVDAIIKGVKKTTQKDIPKRKLNKFDIKAGKDVDNLRFVEKPGYRIDTPGEKLDLALSRRRAAVLEERKKSFKKEYSDFRNKQINFAKELRVKSVSKSRIMKFKELESKMNKMRKDLGIDLERTNIVLMKTKGVKDKKLVDAAKSKVKSNKEVLDKLMKTKLDIEDRKKRIEELIKKNGSKKTPKKKPVTKTTKRKTNKNNSNKRSTGKKKTGKRTTGKRKNK